MTPEQFAYYLVRDVPALYSREEFEERLAETIREAIEQERRKFKNFRLLIELLEHYEHHGIPVIIHYEHPPMLEDGETRVTLTFKDSAWFN